MDDAQLRSISAELGAVKDTAKRQQKALKSLQVLVSKGTNVSALLPTIIDLATGECEKSVWQDAIQLLAGVIGYPAARERCSYPSSVFRALVQALSKGDARATTDTRMGILDSRIMHGWMDGWMDWIGLDWIGLDGWMDGWMDGGWMDAIEPETLMRRSLASAPAIRSMVVKILGVCLVKCWPLVTAVSDENMRDSCVDGLRAAISVLSREESDEEICLAAGAIDAPVPEHLAWADVHNRFVSSCVGVSVHVCDSDLRVTAGPKGRPPAADDTDHLGRPGRWV
eukprot:s607_g10.t1